MTAIVTTGDCLELIRNLPDNSIDAVVTDPPYGIRFMGKAWDGADIEKSTNDRRNCPSKHAASGPNGAHSSVAAHAGKYDLSPKGMLAFQQFSEDWGIQALRVLKPGAHLVAFASTRTYHRMVCGLEQAGFIIRDQLAWVFGSGFPKSHNPCKCKPHKDSGQVDQFGWALCALCEGQFELGTALKPAWEPIVLARKPLIGTVECNLDTWGTGALNIEGCRVATTEQLQWSSRMNNMKGGNYASGSNGADGTGGYEQSAGGRWPANLAHDGSDEVVAQFPMDAGAASAASGPTKAGPSKSRSMAGAFSGMGDSPVVFHNDGGSAARFYYCAKASTADRNAGCEHLPTVVTDVLAGHRSRRMEEVKRPDGQPPALGQNSHPTVKPTALMRWLCRLITPPGGHVLDPFAGSGSTGRGAVLEGFDFTGYELDPEYTTIATARLVAAHADAAGEKQAAIDAARQLDMFHVKEAC